MKQGLTSPDIYSWLLVNGNYLKNAYVKKVYTLDNKIIIKLHKKDEGNRDLFLDRKSVV